MNEVTLKMTLDQFNLLQNAINAFVLYNQNQAAILQAGLQAQVQAQIQPVAGTSPSLVENKAA